MDNLKTLGDIMYNEKDGFMIDLRFGKGLNVEKGNEMKKILQLISDEWKEKEYVPKELCDLFIDFYPGIEACSDNYKSEIKSSILEFADEILDLMRDCICS